MPVVSKVAESCSEDKKSSVLEAEEHLGEDLFVKVVVTDEATCCHEIKSVPEAVVDCVDKVLLTEVDLLELRVSTLGVRLLKHIDTGIESDDAIETILM